MSESGKFFSRKIYAAPFGRYEAGSEVESPADEVLVGREGQRAYFIDHLLRAGGQGAYLITGHRGVGKTKFVHYCLNEYRKEVFERFLQSNVGRVAFWDRILVLALVAMLLLIALLISELAELISLALDEGGGPRNILIWAVLAPLIVLCLYPALFAKEVLDLVVKARRDSTERPPAILWRGVGLWLLKVLGFVGILCFFWWVGPFGSPALSASRLLFAVCALYLCVQSASFRSTDEDWRFGRWSWPTFVVALLLIGYVFFLRLPPKVFGFPQTPIKEFRGNLGLALLLAGMGCVLQALIVRRTGQGRVLEEIRGLIRFSYGRVGAGLMAAGLIYLLYVAQIWALILGPVLVLAAGLAFWLSSPKEEGTVKFLPQPLLALTFKAILALVVCLQLLHPVIAKLPVTFLVRQLAPRVMDQEGRILCEERHREPGLPSDAPGPGPALRGPTYDLDLPLASTPTSWLGLLWAHLYGYWLSLLQTSLAAVPGLEICTQAPPHGEELGFNGWSVFRGPDEEIRWILCLFLALAMLFFLEYEWIVRPLQRYRSDRAIDPGRPASDWRLSNDRRILRELAELTFPWLLFRAWLPILVASVNLGFERLDHRRVVYAMLASLRKNYHRAFLAWNSLVANLGRLLGLLFLLLLVAIVGALWFSMPDEVWSDATLVDVARNDYQNICDLFKGRQKGAGAGNVICKIPGGSRIFHVLNYNLATVKPSSAYPPEGKHLLFFLVPYMEESWPPERFIEKENKWLKLWDQRPIEPLFDPGIHIRIYHMLLLFLFYVGGKFILRRLPVFPYSEVLKKIDEVTDQLSATTSVTSTTGLPQPSNWLRGFFVDERVRQVQQDPVDPRTVELLFLSILHEIQSSAVVLPGGRSQLVSLPTPEITFVFDELDKLGSPADPAVEGAVAETAQHREVQNAERRRSAELHRLMADMKNLLSSAPARFIFVGGRNLHDEWLADQTARQPLLTNIFNVEVYLPSLLTDYTRRDEADMHRNIGAYIRAQTRRAAVLNAIARRKENLPSSSLKVEAHLEEAFAPSSKELGSRIQKITELLSAAASGIGLPRSMASLAEAQRIYKGKDREEKEEDGPPPGARDLLWEILRPTPAAFARLTESFDNLAGAFLDLQRILEEIQTHSSHVQDDSTFAVKHKLIGLRKALEAEEVHLDGWADVSRAVQALDEERSKIVESLKKAQKVAKVFRNAVSDLHRKLLGEIPGNVGAAREAVANLHVVALKLQEDLRLDAKEMAPALKTLGNELERIRGIADPSVELEIFDVSFVPPKDEAEAVRAERERRDKEKARDLCSDLVQFLAYRSKGNPKRLKELLASFVRPVGRVVLNPDVRTSHFPCEHVLMFDDVTRFRVQLLSRLYRLLARTFRPRVPSYDDKLVMSVLFLADFLFKFHRRAFSWSNLERVDELAHIHRAPDLREVLDTLITDWLSRILHPIRNGMYDFRFLSEMAREIEYISRESQEEMAAFNFTLDESITLKSIYESTIERLSKQGKGKELEDLIAGLGELYEFDQEYETARLYYRQAISLLDEDLRKMIGGGEVLEKQSPALEILGALPQGQRNARLYMTWGIARLRLMLQIGMTFELARNYERAEVEYRNAYTLARSLLLSMLDNEGRDRSLSAGSSSWLASSSDDRLQELKHLTLLFQPVFAEAWIGEKVSGGVDTSIALVEKELWELRQILPFVRELKIAVASSPVDVRHSNFALIISELHNKAGDLYFMKGRQLVHFEDLREPKPKTEEGTDKEKDKDKEKPPRKGQEGYLLQTHYHYCVALHELRRFVAQRRMSSKEQLNIWTSQSFKERWETLSPAAWPAFVYSAAGEAFNDVAESMVARVSLYGLLKRLADLRPKEGIGSNGTPESFKRQLITACTLWIDDERPPIKKEKEEEKESSWKLPLDGYEISAGSVNGWLGIWRADNTTPHPYQDHRLLDFDEWQEHDDATRLAVSVNFMVVGAKYLERGGYLEDSARELLKVCEAVTYYLWWELAVRRLVDWKILREDATTANGEKTLRGLLEDIMTPEAREARLPFWSYLADVGADALSEADEIYHRSRSGESPLAAAYPIGNILPTSMLTLACSLGLAVSHLGLKNEKLETLYKRWTKKDLSVPSLREDLKEALVRYCYPLHDRLHGLVTLIEDAVLDEAPADRTREVLDWSKELMELQARLAAPLYFTPFSSGVAYGLVFWYCWLKDGKLRRDVGKAAERDLAASHEMFTLRATYYQNISGLYYLYDDFNDRQVHFNHAIQMAGSELASALRYSFYLNEVLKAGAELARPQPAAAVLDTQAAAASG